MTTTPKRQRVVPGADVPRAVEQALAATVHRGLRLCVGLSGGVDSVVLLDVLAALAPRHAWRLSAVHVNHQLSPNAAAWAAFCRRLCRERGIPLTVKKVVVRRGNSTEAAARDARYEVYRGCRADVIVLAHNQDDQAETVLLNLLRGAGVKGLAAMPFAREEGAKRVVRPLLDVSRAAIDACARMRRLQWVEDESNADARYLRNFLRADILPLVAQRVPGYRATLTRAAQHFSEAGGLLDALAQIDSEFCARGDALLVGRLAQLSPARASNLLRYFLACRGMAMPDKRALDEALRQALTAKQDARVRIDLAGYRLLRHDGALHLVANTPAVDAGWSARWRGERAVRVPLLDGRLVMTPARGDGIDLERLRQAQVELRVRQGGERLRLDAARPRRPVKDLLQERGVPPWQRERLPFLWSGEHLVWVPGLGIDARFHGRTDAPSVVPQWLANPAAALAGKRGRRGR